jgi:hypothetical protein
VYRTIVDAGNGAVLYSSAGLQINDLFDKSGNVGRGYGLPDFTGEHYGQGFGHGPFGFGHWKDHSGFNGRHDGNSNGTWPWL